MKMTLMTPTGAVAQHDAAYVNLPGVDGDFGVLPGHVPLVSTLRPESVVEVKDMAGKSHSYVVSGGFGEVSAEGVTVLTETAKPVV